LLNKFILFLSFTRIIIVLSIMDPQKKHFNLFSKSCGFLGIHNIFMSTQLEQFVTLCRYEIL